MVHVLPVTLAMTPHSASFQEDVQSSSGKTRAVELALDSGASGAVAEP